MRELSRRGFDPATSTRVIKTRLIQKNPRVNNQIKLSQIRLIDENGQNLGIVETDKALEIAREKGLDLIEIAPNVRPPVCRIMDYGKYQYQKSREERQQKTKQKKIEIKGVRISLRTGQHDLEVKVKQANKFLDRGHKVKIEMILRGREKALLAIAKEKLNKFIELISPDIEIEKEAERQPRGLSVMVIKPHAKTSRESNLHTEQTGSAQSKQNE